jgi:DNA-binding IclR family transcriptional regulator
MERSQYRAPALEKGLDIIELLATEPLPLTASAIVQRLGRSTGELFRMIQVLERRGFLAQGNDGYSLTSKLFEMGMERPPVRNLVEIALPAMRGLAMTTGQSCHLAFRSLGDMVIVARMEPQEQLGFSLRVGYRQPLYLATSGITLYAFQSDATRADWEKSMRPAPDAKTLKALRQTADEIRTAGYVSRPSTFVEGITDTSAPILRGDSAAAVLAVPFVRYTAGRMSLDETIAALREAAADISSALIVGDSRV